MNFTQDAITIGVIGIGAMGQGIAQVAAQGGMTVKLLDARAGGAAAGLELITGRINRLVEKERISAEDATRAVAALSVCESIDALSDCQLVVEAVFEDLALKRQLLADLEAVLSDTAIIASNTSSILISSLARDCQHKHRIAGLHFFNPVPLMKLVEVVRTTDTDDATVQDLVAAGQRMGRVPVVVKDSPGFLVNLGGRAYTTEAARLLHEQVAPPAVIDAVMRDCCGFRMGPLELMDLTGVDVNFPVSQIVYDGYFQDPRLKTSFPHRALLEAKRWGRKTGQGNYQYDDKGKRIDNGDADFSTTLAAASAVCLIEASESLTTFARSLNCRVLDHDDNTCPLLAAPVGEDCSSLAARLGIDHKRLVAVDLACNTTKRVTVMSAPGVDQTVVSSVARLVSDTGIAVSVIKDSPGFIGQRLRAMIANLGCEMAQIGIAAPADIDMAMELGLNYPQGPLTLANEMGVATVLTVLNHLQDITGEDRYRPSLWLKRRALLNIDAYTPA